MELAWYYWIILPLSGFVGMYSGGYWGVGCSWLIVPVMLLLGATPMEAAGIALLQMVPSTLPVVIRDAPQLGWGKQSLGLNLFVPLGVVCLIFSFTGRPANVFFYTHFGTTAFQCFFIGVMLWQGGRILLGHTAEYQKKIPSFGKKHLPGMFAFGSGIGFLSSFLGVGGGMFLRPLLRSYYLLPEKETANGVRFLLLMTSFSGGVSYFLASGDIHWRILLYAGLIALGGMMGFPAGVRLHQRVLANGYGGMIHKSFAVIAANVIVDLLLTMAGYINFSRFLMIGMALVLFIYLEWFGRYTQKHPRQ